MSYNHQNKRMKAYKKFSKKKTICDMRDYQDSNQTQDFINLFQNLYDFWYENNIEEETRTLIKMYDLITDKNLSFQIDDNVIKDINIIDFILERIEEVRTFEPISIYSITLDFFLKILLSLYNNSISLQNQLIEQQSIFLFWETSLIQISDVYIDSLKLIGLIVESGQVENEISSLLPEIFKQISAEKEKNSKYVTNMLPIILTYCDITEQSILEEFANRILNIIQELIQSNNYYDYCRESLKIACKLQYRHIDIFLHDRNLFNSILDVIEDYRFEPVYNIVLRFMNLSIVFNTIDDPKTDIINEILTHIDRIIKIFQVLIDNKNAIINVVNLFSNLIVDRYSIIEKLLDDKFISTIVSYYDEFNFAVRNSIMWLVWNMLNGCSVDQLNIMLKNDEIHSIIIDSLDNDDSEFLFNVSNIIQIIINKLGYIEYGTNNSIDDIIDKTQSTIEDADIEIKEIFHKKMPQFF